MNEKFIVTIDGTSSTGKSTIAKRIANKLGYVYIDSGAMYRALTYYCLEENILSNSFFKKNILIQKLNNLKIDFKKNLSNQSLEINLNGNFVEDKIRSLEVSEFVSKLAKLDDVRTFMVKIQHSLGKNKGVVMDGRDIGTVVFPNAEYKFFLKASAKLRAQRRYDQLTKEKNNVLFEDVYKNIISRDNLDINRSNSPLKKASDAILIDTENLSLNQLEDEIFKYIIS
jgi:cytidylate kinase